MHEIYELKERLLKELEEYGRKGDLSTGSLDVVDKLAHTVKNLCKILEESDEGYSNGMRYTDGRMYTDGRSYARGRTGYVRRDSMGRFSNDGYSRDDAREDLMMEVREFMKNAPEEDKHAARAFMNHLKNA